MLSTTLHSYLLANQFFISFSALSEPTTARLPIPNRERGKLSSTIERGVSAKTNLKRQCFRFACSLILSEGDDKTVSRSTALPTQFCNSTFAWALPSVWIHATWGSRENRHRSLRHRRDESFPRPRSTWANGKRHSVSSSARGANPPSRKNTRRSHQLRFFAIYPRQSAAPPKRLFALYCAASVMNSLRFMRDERCKTFAFPTAYRPIHR